MNAFRWNIRVHRVKEPLLGGGVIDVGPTSIQVEAEFMNYKDALDFETKIRAMLDEE